MKRIFKALALMLMVGMLYNVIAYAATNPATEQAKSSTVSALPGDVVGTDYEEALSLLSHLNIVKVDSEGLFKPDNDLTRAEAALIIANLLGLRDVVKSGGGNTRYSDVPADSEYVGAINCVTDLKVIKGYSDGTFRPDTPVKYEEFIKMLICAIGKDVVAETQGGYPYGYIAVAATEGITQGMSVKTGENIKRGPAAVYAYNTLFAEVNTANYVNGSVQYSKDNGTTTLLEEIFNIKKKYGIIVANEYTALNSGSSATSKGMVEVAVEGSANTVYDIIYPRIKELLGYNVMFFVQSDNSNNDKIVSAVIRKGKNDVLTIDAKDISEVTSMGGYYRLKYNDANNTAKSFTADIDLSANVIYNQRSIGAISGIDETDLKNTIMPNSGKIVTIDNNGDGRIDVIFVTSYENYIINGVYPADSKISLKSNTHQRSSIDLDPNDNSYIFTIIKDGKEIGISDLKPNDMVSLVQSKDNGGRVIKFLYVSDKTLEGTVQELREDEGNNYVTIDGQEYKLAYDVNKVPTVGSGGLFYINYVGEIMYVDLSKDISKNYGYMTDIGALKGVADDVQVQIVTTNNELKVLTLKSPLTFNDTSVDASVVMSRLKDKPQLIKYGVDSDGKITRIETAVTLPAGMRYDESRFVLNASNTSADSTIGYYFKTGTPPRIGGLYAIPKDCIIYTIPKPDDQGKIKAEDIRVSNDTSTFTNDVWYLFEVYDVDRNMNAKVLVSYGVDTARSTEGSLSWNQTATVVDKITKYVNSDGETKYKLYGLQNGKPVVDVISDEPVDADKNIVNLNKLVTLSRGSMVQYKKNVDGEIDGYRIIYNPSPAPGLAVENGVTLPGIKYWSTGTVNTIQLAGILGTVDAMDDNVIVITTDGGQGATTDTLRTLGISDSNPIYVYDQAKDIVRVGTKADIIPAYGSPGGSLVFARTYQDSLCELEVLKLKNLQ